MVPFYKMMTRQRIRNYCLKDLVTFWMTKLQKSWICCLEQLGSIILNQKNKYEVVMDLRKNQSNGTRLFHKNTYGRTMSFKCTISVYCFKRIVILQKMTHLPPFSALYELSSKSSQIITFIYSFMPVIKHNSRKL